MESLIANTIAAVVVGGYFLLGFGLSGYMEAIRIRGAEREALPHPLAYFGPSIWVYAFSGKHRLAHDPILSGLVRAWRVTIILLPIGIFAFFAQGGPG